MNRSLRLILIAAIASAIVGFIVSRIMGVPPTALVIGGVIGGCLGGWIAMKQTDKHAS
jgi:F0F1-type ATP synthase assembly protein I